MRATTAVAALSLLAAVGSACGGGRSGPPVTTVPPTTTTTAPPPTHLGTVEDPAVVESSGLAASRRNPGLLWTHNDSGDGARLYCLDRTGRSCGTWTLAGVDTVDWEDMAAGPGPEPGVPYLYVGDIGDNRRTRAHVTVVRLPEPETGPAGAGAGARTAGADVIALAYPDGPHDAEALAVHPSTGDLYVVTKELGPAGVYKAPAASLVPGALPVALQPVATIEMSAVTAADISPGGRGVVLCTYGDAFELVLPPGREVAFDAVWQQAPERVRLAPRLQGEALAYRLDGAAVLTTNEGISSPLYEVVLPRRPR